MKEQIEKMAEELNGRDFCKHLPRDECNKRHCSLCQAEILYEEGYRKHIEGEWVRQKRKNGVIAPEAVCSNCGRDVEYQVIDGKYAFENYCSHCGAYMKGGAE